MCWACLKLNLLQRHCRQGWPMCLMLVSYVVLWSLCAIFVSKCLISLENLKWFIYNPPGITFILRHFRFTESAHHLDKIPRRWRKKSLATLPDGVKVGGYLITHLVKHSTGHLSTEHRPSPSQGPCREEPNHVSVLGLPQGDSQLRSLSIHHQTSLQG